MKTQERGMEWGELRLPRALVGGMLSTAFSTCRNVRTHRSYKAVSSKQQFTHLECPQTSVIPTAYTNKMTTNKTLFKVLSEEHTL